MVGRVDVISVIEVVEYPVVVVVRVSDVDVDVDSVLVLDDVELSVVLVEVVSVQFQG